MDFLFSQLVSGLASGAIYACLALAVVMIYQAIHHLNFAQGEMAMFSTYIAWQLIAWGIPYWGAFVLAIAISFAGGWLLERTVMRPIHDAPVLTHIIIFIALFTMFNSLAGWIWGFTIKSFPSPFGEGPLFAGSRIGKHQMGMIVVMTVVLLIIWAFFKFTRVGLAMRAAAANPESAALVGISVGTMTALGWGMASAVGAVAGTMIAPIVFLEPNMMLSILVYAFAGAVLGGLTSPGGAVLGGLIVGVIEALAGAYIPVVGSELKLPIALALIIVVLLVQPAGIFGRRTVERL